MGTQDAVLSTERVEAQDHAQEEEFRDLRMKAGLSFIAANNRAREAHRQAGLVTRYYTPEVHKGAFALPRFIDDNRLKIEAFRPVLQRPGEVGVVAACPVGEPVQVDGDEPVGRDRACRGDRRVDRLHGDARHEEAAACHALDIALVTQA